MVLPIVRVFFSLVSHSLVSVHMTIKNYFILNQKNSKLVETDVSLAQVTLTLKNNEYFVQLLHVSPYKDSITPNLLLAIHKAFLTMSTLIPMSNQLPLLFHYRINYLINDLERVQKRALSIIYPYVSYNEALVQAGLSRLVDHHQDLCKSLFYNILEDTNHRLHHLLPPQFSTSYSLWNPRTFDIKFNTKRAKNTFFNAQSHLVNSFKA